MGIICIFLLIRWCAVIKVFGEVFLFIIESAPMGAKKKDKAMKKMAVASVVGLTLLVSGCQKQGGQVDIKTEEDKTFYSIGTMFGSRLGTLNLNEKELDAMAQGLRDAAQNKKPLVDPMEYQAKVQEMFKSRMESAAKKTKDEGTKFIENFLKEEGAKKTESGLAYKIITPGSDKHPKETDEVEVHYHGTLINGEVFDSSVDRGQKITFPLNRVIKGWTEGLQLIGEGGKVKLVIPSELAYGEHGAPPKIPGGATLVFDVELFSIKDAAKPAAKAAKKKK